MNNRLEEFINNMNIVNANSEISLHRDNYIDSCYHDTYHDNYDDRYFDSHYDDTSRYDDSF